MSATPETVATGIRFGEGPVWCPGGVGPAREDTLIVTSVADGALYRIWPDEQRVELLATTGGGANGAALAADGSVLVTQNGGIDFAAMGLYQDAPPQPLNAAPGLQLAHTDGRVVYLAGGDTTPMFNAPNDLCVAADGTVYFTDPGRFPPPESSIGRVMAYDRDGRTRVVADGFWYCNGIALEPAGDIVVVERAGLVRLHDDGSREWIIESMPGGGDGFCVDVDGRFYVAATVEHGIHVVEPDGTMVDFLAVPGPGVTTNCCFGGPELRSLFVTDALAGTVVVWTDMPAPGLPLPAWPGRA